VWCLSDIFTIVIFCDKVGFMWKPTAALPMSLEQKRTLEAWVRARNTPQTVALRARICLLASEGMPNNAIAKRLETSRPTVLLWRKRFKERGVLGLSEEAPKGPSKRRLSRSKVDEIVQATLHTKPPGATHWSVRTMAKAQGVSHATVTRIWQAHGLKPHRVKTFKLSKDKRFVEKLTDVVGLYLNPPDKAVVLCVDEKSQIQALDRTQPGLPMKKGRCGTMTHDYKRNGTTTLFAVLNILDGTVIGSCYPRHRHEEFLKFLRKIDRETPDGMNLHLIVDNYGTHKHPNVKKWLSKHKRFHLHFIPTSSSWLNLIERWFGKITQKRIRRGVFHSVPDLIAAIEEYIGLNNQDPKPFVWTKKVDEIIQKVNRCKAIMETLH
jgi:transposase